MQPLAGAAAFLVVFAAAWLVTPLIAAVLLGDAWFAIGITLPLAFSVAAYRGYRGWRPGRLVAPAIVVLAVAWVLAEIAIERDWHDADGFVDCYTACTSVQRSVAGVFFGVPALALAFLLFVLGSWVLASRRRRTRG
jgi:hypothetical protein